MQVPVLPSATHTASLPNPATVAIFAGDTCLATHAITRSPWSIGRAPDCQLVLDNPYIAAHHAVLRWQAEQWWLEPLSPHNPVRIAGTTLDQADRMVALPATAEFELGPLLVRFRQATPDDGAADTTSVFTAADGTLPLGDAQVLRVSYGEISTSYALHRPLVSIGRDPASDIVIPLRTVSRTHATLQRTSTGYVILDQQSANGLLLRGQRVQQHALQHGDTLTIADALGNYVTLAYEDLAANETPPLNTLALALGQDALTIGRAPDNALCLAHPLVSAHHAVLQRDEGGVFLTDLGSTNGTYVQGQRISRVQLQAGNLIQIAGYQFIYREQGSIYVVGNQSLRLDALRLTYTLSAPKRTLIDDVTLSIYPHELVALVGGSGTGKSSVLRALAGLLPPQHGQVLLGGDDLYTNLERYRTSIGYVPQQDVVLPQLTVERTLWYAAHLRLPAELGTAERQQRIDTVLHDVELEPVRHLQVAQLSGGQRRRVSIAVELLAQPLFLLLDEPTTGLDPALEKRFMLLLRSLAERYCTIVLVTHATASLLLCDRVAVLGAGGRLCFYGAPYEVRAFFETTTFAEIYPRIEKSGAGATEWQLAFRQSPYYDEYVNHRLATLPAAAAPAGTAPPAPEPPVAPSLVGFWRQARLLAQRFIEQLLADWQTLVLLGLQAVLAGSLIRLVAPAAFLADGRPPQDGQRVIFLLVLAAVLLGVLAAARELTRERAVYQRERVLFLRPFAYLIAKLAGLLPLAALLATLLLLPVLVGQPLPAGLWLPAPLEWWFSLWLTLVGSMAMGLLISALSTSSEQALSMVPLLLLVQILLAGLIVPLHGWLAVPAQMIVARGGIQSLGTSADLNRLYYQTYAAAPPGIFAPDIAAPPDAFNPADYDRVARRAASTLRPRDSRRLHLLLVWGNLLGLIGLWIGLAGVALHTDRNIRQPLRR